MPCSLCSITVSLLVDDGLSATLDCIYSNYNHIDEIVVVVSIASEEDLSRLRDSRDYLGKLKIIANSDTGIYNAMNLALLTAESTHAFFLNSGDLLLPGIPFEAIRRGLGHELVVMLSMVVEPTYHKSWLRSPFVVSDSDGSLVLQKLPAHCSCIFPLPSAISDRIFYDETKPVSADTFFIHRNAAEFGIRLLPYIFGVFVLDGISSLPSLRSVTANFASGRYVRSLFFATLLLLPFGRRGILSYIRGLRSGYAPVYSGVRGLFDDLFRRT